MKTPPSAPGLSAQADDHWAASDGLRVAAIYEDFASGVRLTEALASLGESIHKVRLISKIWNFHMLERLDVRAAALHDAMDADLLMVVAPGDRTLPVQITRWLERCLQEGRRRPAALVELHDEVLDYDGAPVALSAQMAQLAGRWQMDLITNRQFDGFLGDDSFRPSPFHLMAGSAFPGQ